MSWQCDRCATLNGENARYCRNCGTPRAAQPAEAPAVSPSDPALSAAHLIGVGLLTPGLVLRGRYQVTREVAKGGQGAVYEATDNRTGRRVAIKAVRLDTIARQQDYTRTIERIQRQAQMLSMLSHPHIVRVLEQFQESGCPYIVMEYLEGQTLAKTIAGFGGRLPEQQVIRIALQLCSALSYLHEQNPPIIFRDVKPENVMVDPAQNVKLIDFGIARRYRFGARSDTQLFGSIGYAAPEQYGTNQSDARTDIYSLGATVLCMVTGFNPAANSNPGGDLPTARSLNPNVTAALDGVISRATRRQPDQRWQTAREMGAALRQC